MIILIKIVKYAFVLLLLFAISSALIYLIKKPSNKHKWEAGQEKNATVLIDAKQSLVRIRNMRNFEWSGKSREYQEFEFKLDELDSLKVVVSHFSAISELAHVFLLFKLTNGKSFGLSVEARREKDESFSLLGGLLARYELMYLVASEEDLMGLRKQRNEKIYLYPIKTNAKDVQQLFRVAASKINEMNKKPAFYHLFFKNCTTQIVKLVNQVSDRKYPKFVQAFTPGKTGKALYKMGLIDIPADNFKDTQEQALFK